MYCVWKFLPSMEDRQLALNLKDCVGIHTVLSFRMRFIIATIAKFVGGMLARP